MLVSDYVALVKMIPQYISLRDEIETATRMGQKIKAKRATDMLSIAANFMSLYLQEFLCRSKPGKAMPFVHVGVLARFVGQMESRPRNEWGNPDVILEVLQSAIEFMK